MAEHGAGPAVLALHGQPGSGDGFSSLVPALVPGHRLLLADRPGYGLTGGSAIGMTQNADRFASVLREAGAAPAVVIGHSYGGGVAVLLAARHPEVVSGLVLVGSIGDSSSVTLSDRVAALPVVGDALVAGALYGFGRLLPPLRELARPLGGRFGRWIQTTLPDEEYAEAAGRSATSVWKAFRDEQRFLVSEIDEVEAAIAEVEQPTAVITGAWDAVVSPRVAAGMARRLANARLMVLEGVGHFVPRDAPGAIAEAVAWVEERFAEG